MNLTASTPRPLKVFNVDHNLRQGQTRHYFTAQLPTGKAAYPIARAASICSNKRRGPSWSPSLFTAHASAEQAPCQESYQEVHEYIILLQVNAGTDNDIAEGILDKFWSLQYMIPAGVLNAFAGPVKTMHAAQAYYNMTHALHLRFVSMEHIHKFRQHQKLQKAKDEAQGSVAADVVELSVTGKVPKDLNSIFQKGAEWDLGLNHILILQERDDATQQEMQSFLQALGEVVRSPAINAVQTTYGVMSSLSGNILGSYLVLTRLALQEQLNTLLLSPPHVALARNDARLPATVVASYAMSVGPAQAQKSREPDGRGVLGVSNM